MYNKKDKTELEHIWSVVNHDLASPLSVIQNNLHHLDKTLLPTLLDTYKIAKNAGLNVPVMSSGQLASYEKLLKNTLLDVDQIRQQMARWNHKFIFKYYTLENKPVAISNCVEKAIADYKTSYVLENKSLIHVNIQDAMVSGSEDLIQFVIFELLNNAEYAIEALGHENPTVSISSSTHDKQYILKIKNESKPISSSDLEQLFDPYFSTKTSHIGLGLTFCKQAMQHMQGDIICHTDNDGKSIEFVLNFSLVK